MLDPWLVQLFHEGQCIEAYKIFGAHILNNGAVFSVYAPNAKAVEVVGDFNHWQGTKMERVSDGGIFYQYIDGVKELENYKYRIETKVGKIIDKADPYAFYSELRPGTSSKVFNLDGYDWHDDYWLKYRTNGYDRPLNIYEVHLGSWKLKKDFTEEEDGSYYSYEEIADLLIPYVKEMGYTHIELMPLMEHPYDGSWGYQPTGYFSATSRYGNPLQLMAFIDQCHQNDIGVIFDFVPVHFVHDQHGLSEFDGGYVYEYQEEYRRYSEWGTSYFDLGKEEVRSFMMSSASFWLDYFHVDGIRYDAVSHLIYWQANKNNGVNDGALEFIKRCNYHLHSRYPGIMLIAEDSTDFSNVTKKTNENGLDFDYKWDLGWMNDTLKYMAKDPVYRQYEHSLITFSMAYNFNERFILPFSHDEVVHSKKTIIDKIWGNMHQKMAQLKTLYIYMFGHPGKKLNFMGNELAEFKEWDEKKSLGWNILTYPIHDAFHHFMRDLHRLYLNEIAMSKFDYDLLGFQWMVVDDNKQSVFAFTRRYEKDILVFVLNFTENKHYGYMVPVPVNGKYIELINTDQDIYSGGNFVNEAKISENYSLQVNIAPFASMIFKCSVSN